MYIRRKKLSELDSTITLLSYTANPDLTVAVAARRCYSNTPTKQLWEELSKSKEKQEKIIDRVVKDGHTSTLEHASFTFGVDNVTRAFLAQITRHRVGIAFSVQSQRYCDLQGTPVEDLYYPDSQNNGVIYKEAYENALQSYEQLEKSGEKLEDARMVLPNGFPTSMVISMNAREIRHVLGLRMCVHAQKEIRQIATAIKYLVTPVAPLIFKNLGANCQQYGFCPENSRGCGKFPTINELLKLRKRVEEND